MVFLAGGFSHEDDMSHAYTQQQLIDMAASLQPLPRVRVEGATWVWLHEAQVWFQLEGPVEGSCMSVGEMDAHLLASEPTLANGTQAKRAAAVALNSALCWEEGAAASDGQGDAPATDKEADTDYDADEPW